MIPAIRWLLGVLAACGGDPPDGGRGTLIHEAPPEPAPEVAVGLRFEDAGVLDGTDTPRTHVRLVVIDTEHGRVLDDVGTFSGACTPANDGLGAVVAARCWWAGAGTDVLVRRDGDRLVVTVIELDEEAGPGPPRVAVERALPARATLRPITAD